MEAELLCWIFFGTAFATCCIFFLLAQHATSFTEISSQIHRNIMRFYAMCDDDAKPTACMCVWATGLVVFGSQLTENAGEAENEKQHYVLLQLKQMCCLQGWIVNIPEWCMLKPLINCLFH